jgi:hypothetical protein
MSPGFELRIISLISVCRLVLNSADLVKDTIVDVAGAVHQRSPTAEEMGEAGLSFCSSFGAGIAAMVPTRGAHLIAQRLTPPHSTRGIINVIITSLNQL